MKKLILLLTLTMMFGQTKLETRLYTIENYNFFDSWGGICSSSIFEDLNLNIDYGFIEFINAEPYGLSIYDQRGFIKIAHTYNGQSIIDGNFFVIDFDEEIVYSNQYGRPLYSNESMDYKTCFYNDTNSSPTNTQYSSITIAITAEFPDMDTGYIEDGFDYCVEPGANLMSYPCDSSVALLDAIPSDALSQFTGIIGQGVAATNLNGIWVGSLQDMQASSGYWIQSNTSLCFNYDCSEN